MIIFRSVLLRARNVSDSFVGKITTEILYSKTFYFRKSSCLQGNVEKYCRSGQAKGDNMAHANCMLDTYGYRHTHLEYVILITVLVV